MAKIAKRRSVSCSIKHVNAFVLVDEDGKITVKCGALRTCGDTCPYLTDPDYKSPFKRAPQYKAE